MVARGKKGFNEKGVGGEYPELGMSSHELSTWLLSIRLPGPDKAAKPNVNTRPLTNRAPPSAACGGLRANRPSFFRSLGADMLS
jgi:hypothetical protein